jgi:hypothetical protein
MADPRKMVLYPMVYEQSFQVANVPGSTSASAPAEITVSGFRSGEVLSILMGVVKESSLLATVGSGGGNGWRQPFKFEEVGDVQTYFNGQIYYNSPGKLYKLQQLADDMGAPYWVQEIFSADADDGSGAVSTNANYQNYLIDMKFAQFPAKHDEGGHVQRGIRIDSNTVNIRFTTPDTDSYRVFLVYQYSATIKFQAGTAEWIL